MSLKVISIFAAFLLTASVGMSSSLAPALLGPPDEENHVQLVTAGANAGIAGGNAFESAGPATNVAAVPEPSTLVFLGLGLAGAATGYLARRRRLRA